MGFLGAIILLFVVLPPFWRLFERTGHHGGWSFLMIVPFVNLIALYWLAFKRWPVEDTGEMLVERFE